MCILLALGLVEVEIRDKPVLNLMEYFTVFYSLSDTMKKRRKSDVKSLNHDDGNDSDEQQALAPSHQQGMSQHLSSPKIGHMSHKSMGSVDYGNRRPIDTHEFVNRLSVTQPGSERGDLQELKHRPLPPVPADGNRDRLESGYQQHSHDEHDGDDSNHGITPGGGLGGRRKKQYSAVDKSSGSEEDEDSVVIHEEFKENEDKTRYPQSQIVLSTAGRDNNGSDDGIIYRDSDDDMVKVPAPPPPPALPTDMMDTGHKDGYGDGDGDGNIDDLDSDSNDQEHDGLYRKPSGHHRTKTNE